MVRTLGLKANVSIHVHTHWSLFSDKRRYEPLPSNVSSSGGAHDQSMSSTRQSQASSVAETPSTDGKPSIDTGFTDTEPKDSESESKQLSALMHSTGEKEEKVMKRITDLYSIAVILICSSISVRNNRVLR